MHRRQVLQIASMTAAASACGMAFAGPQSTQPEKKTKRVVPVTNVVPNGAQPVHGDVVKVEVIDAVDLKRTNWELKVAVRIRNARQDRVRCQLAMLFDGQPMGQPWNVDLLDGEYDLVVFANYGVKGASQLGKLTAEAREIRIGN